MPARPSLHFPLPIPIVLYYAVLSSLISGSWAAAASSSSSSQAYLDNALSSGSSASTSLSSILSSASSLTRSSSSYPSSSTAIPTPDSTPIPEFKVGPIIMAICGMLILWTQRISIFFAVITILPWFLAVVYDIGLYAWRCISFEIPIVGGRAQTRIDDVKHDGEHGDEKDTITTNRRQRGDDDDDDQSRDSTTSTESSVKLKLTQDHTGTAITSSASFVDTNTRTRISNLVGSQDDDNIFIERRAKTVPVGDDLDTHSTTS